MRTRLELWLRTPRLPPKIAKLAEHVADGVKRLPVTTAMLGGSHGNHARLLEVTKALPGETDELVGIHTAFPCRTWQMCSKNSEMRVQELWLAGKVTT